jgi:hypothetical protein
MTKATVQRHWSSVSCLNLCEEAIKIGVCHVFLHARHVLPDLLHRRSQLRLAASRNENVRAFVDETLRGRKTNPAIASGDECDFSFKLTHPLLL